ncbi:MAG: MFS transporter [Candidatus Neomarinimicrobiota bacterium]|nr:MFS transporter [Candidatus Neomarinimicrobiota bacterium]MEC8689639.1 MFS transporter [Candidatus Neomarinimicrobiota bacterium]|tara:strand:- start:632 stop:1909 length:1278 start_codon:yes stop_codon:yes gene_type:complete
MLDDRKQIISWSLYDWANSTFSTTVMAGFFPIFFQQYWSTASDVTVSTWYLGLANSLASIAVASLAPFLGAIADKASVKKRLLIFFAFIGIISTGALSMVGQGYWKIAAVFYVVASVGFMSANIFYDSLLPSVASKQKRDFVSSLGYSLGYIGGGILFLVNVAMYLKPQFFGIADAPSAIKLSFLTVAVWWAIFTLPILIFVKEKAPANDIGIIKSISAGWIQLLSTLKRIRELKVVTTFLIAYWLYIDGVDTIIRMSVDYGTSLGFTTSTLITLLLMVQFIAFPATLIYNWFAKQIGIKQAILIAIGGYICIAVIGSLVSKEWHFYIIATLIGCFQGGIQALSRSLYSRIIPSHNSAEFFGFYNMFGKFATIIGPPLMGYVAMATGNPRFGILAIILLFVLGGYFLMMVDVEEGERVAQTKQNY